MNSKVTILQDRLLHYRVGLFEHLKRLADERDIALSLVHGQASPLAVMKKDEGYLDWTLQVKNRWWVINGHDLLWQPLPQQLLDSDLVVMLQHNRILSNYKILFGGQRRRSKIAFWGHGKNFQSKKPRGMGERFKQRLILSVDWWFTYTQTSVQVIEKAGFDPARITCLNNAIDTKTFQADLASITPDEIRALKEQYGIPEHSFIGLFCGSIYPDKKPEIMIEAGKIIKSKMPEFHFFVIGDGPSAGQIKEAAVNNEWLHYVGVKKGRDKAKFFRISHVAINPGLVGLHVLDAFAAGLPMVTMAESKHSPEICYLVDGHNGYLTGNSLDQYADAILKLFNDKAAYRAICRQALLDAQKYTVERMAENFIDGIEKCLETA
jgi:glycosyltransferase involved in cell wall biosynthesis